MSVKLWSPTSYSRIADLSFQRDVATAEVSTREKQAAARAAARRRGPPSIMLLLLVLALFVALLYMGPVYPNTVQQLHLHVKLPQISQSVELKLGGAGLLARDSVQPALAGVSDSAGRTLSFEVCSGFAHQRADIVTGLILAVELNRTMVLPRLLVDGSQHSDSQDAIVGSVEFGEMFDAEEFVSRLRLLGVHTTPTSPPSAQTAAGRLGDFDSVQALANFYAAKQHLRLDCPAFRIPADLVVKHEKLVFAAMDAMRPAHALQEVIDRAKEQLRGVQEGQGQGYNFLYLRAEDEWLVHCSNWESIHDGIVRDNCMTNTARVGDQLRLHRVDRQLPLLVGGSSESQSDNSLLQQAIQNLEAHSYDVVLQDEVYGHGLELPVLAREEAALVDYYLALGSHQFVGNSVSISSALLIMERWHAGKFATHYNGGNIPLESYMPLYQMPWVFTYNDWSAGTEYDHMVKAAVTSAIEVARMKPFCMYSGSTTADMYQWLLSKGVTIIQHEPAWRDALVKEGARNKEANMVHSHLYRTGGTLVGTFQRIDIPILQQFDQYNYVLFTDCDVYFRQQMKLVDWGTPLPIAVGMGFEGQDIFPYNAGIMLMNMPYMRKTNKKFLNWILAQKNGLYYPGYGPLDQGALNQFYEKQIRGKPISKNFNSMSFHQFRPESRIVHMNGPKPNHYLEWLEIGKCVFGDMCKMGAANGLCSYMAEYVRFTPDWEVPSKIHKLCVSGTVARFSRPGLVEAAAATSLPRSEAPQQPSRLPAITRLAAAVHAADAGEELEMKAVRQQFMGRSDAEQAGALAEQLPGDASMPTDEDVPAKGHKTGLTSRAKIRSRAPIVTVA